MKTQELLERAKKGEILTIVEYRGTSVEQITYKDKTTGAGKEFVKLQHNVETANGSEAYKIDEDTRRIEKFDPVGYKARLDKGELPFKKGAMVVFVVESFAKMFTKTGDIISAKGHLETLEA